MSFGSRIRQLREHKGLKAKFVAERLELTPAQYCDLEKGRKKLTAELIVRLAEVLGVTADDILYPDISATLTYGDENSATSEGSLAS